MTPKNPFENIGERLFGEAGEIVSERRYVLRRVVNDLLHNPKVEAGYAEQAATPESQSDSSHAEHPIEAVPDASTPDNVIDISTKRQPNQKELRNYIEMIYEDAA